jgi:hypothetical protein
MVAGLPRLRVGAMTGRSFACAPTMCPWTQVPLMRRPHHGFFIYCIQQGREVGQRALHLVSHFIDVLIVQSDDQCLVRIGTRDDCERRQNHAVPHCKKNCRPPRTVTNLFDAYNPESAHKQPGCRQQERSCVTEICQEQRFGGPLHVSPVTQIRVPPET